MIRAVVRPYLKKKQTRDAVYAKSVIECDDVRGTEWVTLPVKEMLSAFEEIILDIYRRLRAYAACILPCAVQEKLPKMGRGARASSRNAHEQCSLSRPKLFLWNGHHLPLVTDRQIDRH